MCNVTFVKHFSFILNIFFVQLILKNLLQMCLQAGFAAEGAESGTPFNDINLLEKVCCLSFISNSNYLASVCYDTSMKYVSCT